MSTALLVIDVQRMLVDALASARQADLIGTIQSLLARARAGGVPVVYVRHDGGPDELTPGTPGWEIASEIAPRAGEPVVDKRFCDAFRETNLADVVAGIAADHLIVCGMQTEFCVDSTIREADRRGFRVTLVADAHATYDAEGATEEQIRNQVHRVARGIANVVPARDVLAAAV